MSAGASCLAGAVLLVGDAGVQGARVGSQAVGVDLYPGGPQDRWVATRLLDVGRYAAAKALVGPAVGALAAELDVSAWVVEAYRDTLRTRGHQGHPPV